MGVGITAAARWRDNGGPAPVLSVIVPTKDEVENIRPLLARLANVAPEVAAEIIFVDDSSDGTAEEIERLGVDQARSVTVIHRPAGQRWVAWAEPSWTAWHGRAEPGRASWTAICSIPRSSSRICSRLPRINPSTSSSQAAIPRLAKVEASG